MTFKPLNGFHSSEEFSNSEGITLGAHQTITGGYLALEPLAVPAYVLTRSWIALTGWSFSNSLSSVSQISNALTIRSGIAYPNQVTPNGYEGSQSSATNAGAWKIETIQPYYNTSSTGFSGQVVQCLEMNSGSPTTGWYDFFRNAGQAVTIEFDIASVVSVGDPLVGFTGGSNQTGLSHPSGFLSHGLYIDNGSYWDYLEVKPEGIRSYNHPEIALPIDLTQPKRLRVGIRDTDLYIASQDGRGLSAPGKFNTTRSSPSDAKIAIGAVPLSGYGNRYTFYREGVSGMVGETYWSNLNITYGRMAIYDQSGTQNRYVTTPQTGYTSVFDPMLPIQNFDHALVGYVPYSGGITTVTAQYSGDLGWTDYSTISLTSGNKSLIDLTSMPVYSYQRGTETLTVISNPVRFKVVQQSYGPSMPPIIDYIDVGASYAQTFLDVVPNWKPYDIPLNVRVAVKSGRFFDSPPIPDGYTTCLIKAPNAQTGILTGHFKYDESLYDHDVWISGQIELVNSGPWDTAFRTMTVTSGLAVAGSEAYGLYGLTPVTNMFPNPLLEDLGFHQITGDRKYLAGKTFGELANWLTIPFTYTGGPIVDYIKTEVYRPENQARVQRISSYLGYSQVPDKEYVQTVFVPSNTFSGTHDGSCGVEIVIPSGILTTSTSLSFDLQVDAGDYLQVYATGNINGSPRWYLDGSYFRNYRSVSFLLDGKTATSDRVYVGVVVPSGTSSSTEFSFNMDNIEATPLATSYLYVTGVNGLLHHSGLSRVDLTNGQLDYITRAATVASLDAKLLAYPTGSNNRLLSKRRTSDNRGFHIFIDPSGYLNLASDISVMSWSARSDGLDPAAENALTSLTLRSEKPVPLGAWTNIGMVHQAAPYSQYAGVGYDEQIGLNALASTNRIYLTIDGYPVGVADTFTGWNGLFTPSNGEVSPLVTMIPDGTGTFMVGSGLLMEMDAISLSKPPVADCEIDLSIRAAKVCSPYFVADTYFKPTADATVSNALVDDSITYNIEKDFYLGSIYSFDGPAYTHWDHGPWRNHLLAYGSVGWEYNSPYPNYGATRFPSGSYALAKYSSTTDRQINTTGNLRFPSLMTGNGANSGMIRVNGWFYPYTTGEFFSLLQDVNNFTGHRLTLSLNSGHYLEWSRANGGTVTWTRTGQKVYNTGEWGWFGLRTKLGNFSGSTQTGVVAVSFITDNGYSGVYTDFTGVGYGFKYQAGPNASAFKFGGTADISLSDWAISPIHYQDTLTYHNGTKSLVSGDKGGRYNSVLVNDQVLTSNVSWSGYYVGHFVMPAASSPSSKSLMVAAGNSYDNDVRLNGGVNLYHDLLFEDVGSYYISYDTSKLESIVGSTNSPIRLGYQVPEGAVNIAKLSCPAFSVAGSISTIDLSDQNPHNLTTYREGHYPISRSNGQVRAYSLTGGFKGINTGFYNGRADITMSGQAITQDIDVTSISIADVNLDTVNEAFYCYLLGRGSYGLIVNNANPHPTGELNYISTSASNPFVDNYIKNLELIKSSITLRDSNGNVIDSQSFPFEVVSSPYRASDLSMAVLSGQDIPLEGIAYSIGATGLYANRLPDSVFSVAIVCAKQILSPNTSVWIHYPSYNFATRQVNQAHREVVNAVPIMRRAGEVGEHSVARFDTALDPISSNYNVTIYGVHHDFTGQF